MQSDLLPINLSFAKDFKDQTPGSQILKAYGVREI